LIWHVNCSISQCLADINGIVRGWGDWTGSPGKNCGFGRGLRAAKSLILQERIDYWPVRVLIFCVCAEIAG
jgi:hypothetical protein